MTRPGAMQPRVVLHFSGSLSQKNNISIPSDNNNSANQNDSFFGAEATTSATIYEFEDDIWPDPFPVTIKYGSNIVQTLTSHGDSSRPISVYANGDTSNYLTSSAGVNINIFDFTLNACFALDNIGLYGSIAKEDTVSGLGLKIDLTQIKPAIYAPYQYFSIGEKLGEMGEWNDRRNDLR